MIVLIIDLPSIAAIHLPEALQRVKKCTIESIFNHIIVI